MTFLLLPGSFFNSLKCLMQTLVLCFRNGSGNMKRITGTSVAVLCVYFSLSSQLDAFCFSRSIHVGSVDVCAAHALVRVGACMMVKKRKRTFPLF